MANELKIVVKFDTGQAKTETKQFAEGSIGALEKSLRDARKALKDLQIGTQEHAQALVDFKTKQAQLNDALGRGFTAIKNTTGASANATVTLQALNYTVRDSAYFTRDFALGILAVGNNLNPLIDGFIRMKQETGSYKGAMSSLLGTLTGPSGVMFAFSIIVTAIQAVTFAMAKNKKETSETKNEYDKLTDAILRYSKQALGGLIIDLESRQSAFALALATGRKLTEQEQNTAMEIQKQVKFAKERLRTMGDIESINNRMSELETEKKMLKNTGLVDGLISPASVARLKEINAELEKLRKLTSTKDTVAKDKELDLFGVKQDIYGIAYDLAKDMATITNRAMEIYTTDFAGKGMTDKSLPNMWRGGFFKPMEKLDEDVKKPVVELQEDLKIVNELSTTIGNGLYDAFMHGKEGLDQFLSSLAVAIGKMVLIDAIKYGLGSIFAPVTLATKGLGTIFGSVQQVPDIPNVAPISSSSGIAQRLDAVNSNIAGMREPIIIIQADTDAMRFTRIKTNPAQAKLRRGNISVV